MKVTIEFEVDAAETTPEDIFLVLSRAHTKILNQLQRAPGCICTAPEADDQLRNFNGNVIGSVKVECGVDDKLDCTASDLVTETPVQRVNREDRELGLYEIDPRD